jgi:hypothetical protein
VICVSAGKMTLEISENINTIDAINYEHDMYVKFRNTKIVSKNDLALMRDLSTFILEKFFQKKTIRQMDIVITMRDDYLEKYGMYGDCLAEDLSPRPRWFSINLDGVQKRCIILNTLAHELVHVKQWAKDEMYEYTKTPGRVRFGKEIINTNNTDYWDHPWEIEAHGRAIGLVAQWKKSRGLKDDDLMIS